MAEVVGREEEKSKAVREGGGNWPEEGNGHLGRCSRNVNPGEITRLLVNIQSLVSTIFSDFIFDFEKNFKLLI